MVFDAGMPGLIQSKRAEYGDLSVQNVHDLLMKAVHLCFQMAAFIHQDNPLMLKACFL